MGVAFQRDFEAYQFPEGLSAAVRAMHWTGPRLLSAEHKLCACLRGGGDSVEILILQICSRLGKVLLPCVSEAYTAVPTIQRRVRPAPDNGDVNPWNVAECPLCDVGGD